MQSQLLGGHAGFAQPFANQGQPGFIIASFAAMLLIPTLMGYANRRRLLVTAVITVAVLAVIAPYLLNVELPQGVVGDWLIDKLALRAG